MRAVIDTNILIDYLNGRVEAKRELELYRTPSISLVTWMEVLAGAELEEEPTVRDFLFRFQVIGIDRETAETAVSIRREKGLRLPDAIIWAAALNADLILVTRNTRDFPAEHPGIRVPYRL